MKLKGSDVTAAIGELPKLPSSLCHVAPSSVKYNSYHRCLKLFGSSRLSCRPTQIVPLAVTLIHRIILVFAGRVVVDPAR